MTKNLDLETASFDLTPLGFFWGALKVSRFYQIDGRVVIRIQTDTGKQLFVHCSRAGRSLRVFDDRNTEWKGVA